MAGSTDGSTQLLVSDASHPKASLSHINAMLQIKGPSAVPD
jgi:hypothetical protein